MMKSPLRTRQGIKTDNNTIYSVQVIPDQQIGMGYSDNTQMGTSTFCVDSTDIILHGRPVSIVGFGTSMNFQQTQQDLGVDVSASISISKFSGSFTAQYARSIMDVGYSTSFSFVYKIKLPTQILHVNGFGPDALNKFGQGVFNESRSMGNLDRFMEVCGNKFVVQEDSGAKLYVTLNLKFNSQYDKNKFNLNFKGNLADLASAALTVSVASEKHGLSGSIELSAIQEGGNVMRLAEIFGTTNDNNVLGCDLNATAIKSCEKVIGDVINYAKQDFANQIAYNTTGNGKLVGTPTSTGYVYMEYNEVGIDAYNIGVTPEVLAIRKFLGETEDRMLSLNAYLNTLIYSGHVGGLMDYSVYKENPTWYGKWYWQSELIDIQQKAQLQATYSTVNKVLSALESQYTGAIQCYKYPNACVDVGNSINSTINNGHIVESTLALFATAYSLSVNCQNVDYGFRFMLPIGTYTDPAGRVHNKYVENSQFTILNGDTSSNKTLIVEYDIMVYSNSGTSTADLSINGQNCGSFSAQNNSTDAIPVYSGNLMVLECSQSICPVDVVVGNTVDITFFAVNSPI